MRREEEVVGRVRKFASEKHFASVLQVFPDAFVSGKFCDVKIVCEVGDLLAHIDTVQQNTTFLEKLHCGKLSKNYGSTTLSQFIFHRRLVTH